MKLKKNIWDCDIRLWNLYLSLLHAQYFLVMLVRILKMVRGKFYRLVVEINIFVFISKMEIIHNDLLYVQFSDWSRRISEVFFSILIFSFSLSLYLYFLLPFPQFLFLFLPYSLLNMIFLITRFSFLSDSISISLSLHLHHSFRCPSRMRNRWYQLFESSQWKCSHRPFLRNIQIC